MAKREGRADTQHRPISIEMGFHRNAEGSVLYRAGGTVVLCTASVDNSVPKWMADDAGGWLTAEYQMHPRAAPQRRENRDGRGRNVSGRTMEIQRLVGRGLRAGLDLKALGPRTITIDCDVLEADGGTRTASITAGYLATAMALYNIGLAGVLRDQVAAISVGFVDGRILVDLDYQEDSRARVDMNVIATSDGRLIEVQATAEGVAITRDDFDQMVTKAVETTGALCTLQGEVFKEAGMDLGVLMKRR